MSTGSTGRFSSPSRVDSAAPLSRLAASGPAPRLSPFGSHDARHAGWYAGVLASASPFGDQEGRQAGRSRAEVEMVFPELVHWRKWQLGIIRTVESVERVSVACIRAVPENFVRAIARSSGDSSAVAPMFKKRSNVRALERALRGLVNLARDAKEHEQSLYFWGRYT
jgi:hypothetical protein